MLKLKKFNKYELIYLTFAFDSLLKIPLGAFNLHIGILAILLLLPVGIITSSKIEKIKSFVSQNWTIVLFILYLFLNIVMNHEFPGIFVTLAYYILGLSVFYFFYIKEQYISTDAIVTFQWILIFTGLFQFALFKFFGYQLAFIEAEHYMTDASFATRLRGFFVEPNWFSITLSYNILLLVMQLKNKLFIYKSLILFTVLVMFFNSSYTFLGVVVLGIIVRFFIDLPKVSKKRFTIIFLLFFVLSVTFIARSYTKLQESSSADSTTLVNYGSRLFPIIRTTLFMSEQTVDKQLLGVGIGSWPYVGLEQNQLGYIGVAGEYTIQPAQRDSAEYQVFLLEVGYLGLLLFVFDYIYNYWRYRRFNLVYSLASAFMLASFFVYPIFKFAMYLVPYYIIRAKALKEEI
jgi:hypothetical protein